MNAIFLETSMEFIMLPQLSEENKTKVCMIRDINKLNKIIQGRNITPREFDILYDEELFYLDGMLEQLQEGAQMILMMRQARNERIQKQQELIRKLKELDKRIDDIDCD